MSAQATQARERLAESLGALEVELGADDLAWIEEAIPVEAVAGERYLPNACGVRAHVETLVGRLERMIAEGVAGGRFGASSPMGAARAVFDATARFHNPVNAAE